MREGGTDTSSLGVACSFLPNSHASTNAFSHAHLLLLLLWFFFCFVLFCFPLPLPCYSPPFLFFPPLPLLLCFLPLLLPSSSSSSLFFFSSSSCCCVQVQPGDATEDKLRAVLRTILHKAEGAVTMATSTDSARAARFAAKQQRQQEQQDSVAAANTSLLSPSGLALPTVLLAAGLAAYYYTKHNKQHL